MCHHWGRSDEKEEKIFFPNVILLIELLPSASSGVGGNKCRDIFQQGLRNCELSASRQERLNGDSRNLRTSLRTGQNLTQISERQEELPFI